LNTPAAASLRRTALYSVHKRMGARMVDFGGWDMPVEYPSAGLMKEHLAVRTAVGIFDVSHMGDIRITGPQALPAVQYISMNDASRLAIGQAHYSALLYPEGTFVDDVVVHRLASHDFLLVINAGTREKDFNWVHDQVRAFDCTAEDLGDRYTQIAIQGPLALDTLARLTAADIGSLKYYWFTHGCVLHLPNILIARTGYTGEDGFEIYIPPDAKTSEEVWLALLEAGKEFGILPCGLGARNTLRLEAKMALYGHEISESITVLEAGLDRYCKLDKGDFIGRARIEQQKASGITRTLVGLEMLDRGIARDGYKVFDVSAKEIGVVSSGSYAPFLKKNIALAYVPPSHSAEGRHLNVEIRGQMARAQIVPTPFYKRPKKHS
jgi:aminomethyltransferase